MGAVQTRSQMHDAPAVTPEFETAERRAGAPRKTFRIPVSTGIFEHYPKIGEAIWLLLYYIDRTTVEVPAPDGRPVGRVLGGCPVRDSEIARVFCCSTKTIRRWRNRLDLHGYIRARRTPFGTVIEIPNSQKWPAARMDKNVHSQAASSAPQMAHNGAQMGTPADTNGQTCARGGKYKEDKTETQSVQYRERNAANAAHPRPNTSCSVQKQMQQREAKRREAKQGDFVSAAEALAIVRRLRAEFEAEHGP